MSGYQYFIMALLMGALLLPGAWASGSRAEAAWPLAAVQQFDQATTGDLVQVRLFSGEVLALKVTDLLDTGSRQKVPCLANSDLITVFQLLDEESQSTVDPYNNLLRLRIQKQPFTLFGNSPELLAAESMLTVRHSLKTFEGEVFVPISSLRRILRFLEGIELEVPQAVARREYAAPPVVERQEGGATNILPVIGREQTEGQPPVRTPPRGFGATGVTQIVLELGGIYDMKLGSVRQEEMQRAFAEIARRCAATLNQSPDINCQVVDPGRKQPPAERLDVIGSQRPNMVILLRPGVSRYTNIEGVWIYYPHELLHQQSGEQAQGAQETVRPRDNNYLAHQQQTEELVRAVHQVFSNSPVIRAAAPQPTPLYLAHRLRAPTILIELGYCSNSQDRTVLRDEPGTLARALAQGLLDHLRR